MILGLLFGLLLPLGSTNGVYPGIDFILHTAGGCIEYDWIVGPGADPTHIRMQRMTPASVFSSALRTIMNRIVFFSFK